MKKYTRILSALILTLTLLSGCGSGSNSVFVSLAILVEPVAAVYDIGRTAQYKAYALRLDESWVEVTEKVEWTTDDPFVADISAPPARFDATWFAAVAPGVVTVGEPSFEITRRRSLPAIS